MIRKQHIAVVDDEKSIQRTLSVALEDQGYTISLYSSGEDALEKVKTNLPDLIILDIMMPGIDGITFCSLLRETHQNIPIIFLSSRVDELTKLEALKRGGDDYMSKPFSLNELLVRISVCLRRVEQLSQIPACSVGEQKGFHIDDGAYQIYYDGYLINLSVTEFRIFRALFSHPGIVFSRDKLMAAAYPEDGYISDRNVDSHITRIRKKIKQHCCEFKGIESVYGLGYRYRK